MGNTKQIKIATALFVVVSVLDIIGIIKEQEVLRFTFKPMIMLSLMLLYYVSVLKPNRLYLIGLFFSFLGDVFLLFKAPVFFMLGLGAFLMTHLVYIVIVSKGLKKIPVAKMLIASLPFVLLFVGIIWLLKDNLGEMLVPVIVYGLTISIFGTVAFLSYLKYKNRAVLYLLIGAVVFIVSDSMIALNKFYASKEIYEFAIMFTYIIAQYFIYKYMLFREKGLFKV